LFDHWVVFNSDLIEIKQYMNWSLDGLSWLNLNSIWIDHWVVLPWADWT